MANRIAGITVEIGGDTTNTTLLTQKQKLLTETISETKEKLTTLKTAAEQANEALENSDITQEQYDTLQREIVETEKNLKFLADQAAESNAALVKIGDAGEKLQSVGAQTMQNLRSGGH